MKRIVTLLFIGMSIGISSQENKYSDKEFQQKLDSIKAEGNLLYSHEIASWNSGDLVSTNKKLHEIAQNYLTYKSSDTVKTVFLNKDQSLIVAEYSFKNSQKKPVKESFQQRKLNQIELNTNKIRSTVISQLSDPKYEVGAPEGYNLNLIIIPINDNYKVYLIPAPLNQG